MRFGAEHSLTRVSAPGFAFFAFLCLYALIAFKSAPLTAEESRPAAKTQPAAAGSADGIIDSSASLFGGAPVSGDWVVYRDRTWPAPTWVGFISYDSYTWGAFLKTPSTGSDVRILFRTEEADGSLILTGQNIISDIHQSDVEAVNYLMGLLPELWKWSTEAAAAERPGQPAPAVPCADDSGPRSALLPPAYAVRRNLPDFGGEVTLTWAAEVPVFALAGIVGAGNSPILSLERTGRASSSSDTAFFDFQAAETRAGTGLAATGGQASGGAARDPAKTAGKAETRVVDGLKLVLDGNWTMYADNTYFMGNEAVLIAASASPQALGCPPGAKATDLPLALFALFTRSNANAWEVPGNRKLTGSAERFRIETLFYDHETGAVNRDIKLCIPVSDAKGTVASVRVVSLSVRDSTYRANPAYFDAVLPR